LSYFYLKEKNIQEALFFSGVRSALPKSSIRGYASAPLESTKKILDGELSSIKEAGTWKAERIISSRQGATIKVQGQTTGILNFCANNYLGLSVSW
jgi:glycine C-acetyltransferase